MTVIVLFVLYKSLFTRVILPALFTTRETRRVGDRPTPRARTFEPLTIRTVKFRNCFIPHCLSNFD